MRPFNPSYIIKAIPDLLSFLPVTLLMILGTILFGSMLGLILARAKVGGSRFSRALATAYTVAMRCTPPIVLLFMVFYGLPELLLATIGLDINSIYKGIFVIITFTLLFAANLSEVMRAAYESIDKGQREAAVSIGLSEFQAFYRIVLPQATAVALPNFGNALINLMKDGSLAYTIGLIDMMGQGTLIIARNQGGYGLETYLALAIVYWTLTIVIEKLFASTERCLTAGQRTIAA
jgi:L-cystine transport system permease protein